MKKIVLSVVAFLPSLALIPTFAFAAAQGIPTTGLDQTVRGLITVANDVILLFIAISVIAFLYGIIRYVLANGAEEKDRARNLIIYGLLAIFAGLAVFGIVRLLVNLFGLNPQGLQQGETPTIQGF